MLFRQHALDGIKRGSITLAFRRWRRPTVRPGGTQITAIGQLQIGEVMRVSEREIADDDARRAGYDSREALLAELNQQSEGDVYRIEIRGVKPDPRVALRETLPDDADSDVILGNCDGWISLRVKVRGRRACSTPLPKGLACVPEICAGW